MQVLPQLPPRLDDDSPQVNFARVEQYLQGTMETIDFLLAKYAGGLRAVDADSVTRALERLEARLVLLERGQTDIRQRLSALEETVAEQEARLTELEQAGGEG